MNRLTIIGNLTADPELRTTPGGDQVCNFSVAVNRRGRRDAEGNAQELTDFFRVSVWRQQAEVCQRYLTKGRKVAVVGPVTARAYQANDGSLRASLEINATEVEFLSSRNEEGGSGYVAPAAPVAAAPQAASNFTAVETDELPF